MAGNDLEALFEAALEEEDRRTSGRVRAAEPARRSRPPKTQGRVRTAPARPPQTAELIDRSPPASETGRRRAPSRIDTTPAPSSRRSVEPNRRSSTLAAGAEEQTPANPAASLPRLDSDLAQMPTAALVDPKQLEAAVQRRSVPSPSNGVPSRPPDSMAGTLGRVSAAPAPRAEVLSSPPPARSSPAPARSSPPPARSSERPTEGRVAVVGASRKPKPRAKSLPPTRGGRPITTTTDLPLGPDGRPLVDHRGRARPLYKPRGPRPTAFRAEPWQAVLLDVVPGSWFFARKKSLGAGFFYLLATLAALVPGISTLIEFADIKARMNALSIAPQWVLLYGALPLLSISLFAVLRLLAFRGRRRKEPHPNARLLAALTLPALVVVVGAPGVVDCLPALVEPIWFLAIPTVIVGLGGTARHLYAELGLSDGAQQTVTLALVLVLVVASIGLLAFTQFDPGGMAALASTSKSAGFEILPKVLGQLAG